MSWCCGTKQQVSDKGEISLNLANFDKFATLKIDLVILFWTETQKHSTKNTDLNSTDPIPL